MRALILICIAAVAYASEKCGENSHFESCGTACPLTCENYNNPPRFCILSCGRGCHCDEGYVKAQDGSCVKPEQCPSKSEEVCGAHQRWTNCGSPCPLTCDNYQNPPKGCVDACFAGCECIEGKVQNKEGQCVDPEQCPSQAPVIQEKTCTEEPKTGHCMAYFPSWYYDVETGTCKKFIYGGCGGNGNRYRSEEECLKNCQGVSQQEGSVDACDLPYVTGVCRGRFPRFYFDRVTGQCKTFIYGGCGGNENNFETVKECQQKCAPARSLPSACHQEMRVGKCKGMFPRWYFNRSSGQCEKFFYGGCDGNSNNFLSEEDCSGVCLV